MKRHASGNMPNNCNQDKIEEMRKLYEKNQQFIDLVKEKCQANQKKPSYTKKPKPSISGQMPKNTNKSAHYGPNQMKIGIVAQSQINTTNKNPPNRKNHRSTSGNNRDRSGTKNRND